MGRGAANITNQNLECQRLIPCEAVGWSGDLERVAVVTGPVFAHRRMFIDLLLFCAGLTLLYFGAEWLVSGSSSIALRLGITPLIVGCTVVAFGTSAPELVVSIAAVMGGNDDISVGNIVGSNVANLALILGTAALIRPMHVQSNVIRREYPIMLGASILLIVLGYDGFLSRTDGVILLSAMACYIGYMIWIARAEMAQGKEVTFEELDDIDPNRGSNKVDLARVVLGIIGLAVGAQLMVNSAVNIAQSVGVSDLIIAISVVAIGTSLPELATSVVAAMREEADISVGNVVGSNVFNSLLVLGAAAAIAGIKVGTDVIRWDFWAMLIVTVVVWPIMWTSRTIKRWEGAVLLVGYVSYMVWIFLR